MAAGTNCQDIEQQIKTMLSMSGAKSESGVPLGKEQHGSKNGKKRDELPQKEKRNSRNLKPASENAMEVEDDDEKKKRKKPKKKKKKKPEVVNVAKPSLKSVSDSSAIHCKSPNSVSSTHSAKNPRHQQKDEDDPPANYSLRLLQKDYIFPLKKRSARFANAKFFCRLCEYHCFSEEHCSEHMKDTRHQRLKVIKTMDYVLRSLPPPTAQHVDIVTQVVEDIYQKHGLNASDIVARQRAFNILKTMISIVDPSVTVSMYGSTVSGFALEDSDLNLELGLVESPNVLLRIYTAFKEDKSGYVGEVRSDFSAKVPSIHFVVRALGLRCQLGINSGQSRLTSQFLSCYCKINPNVAKLAVALRYWAKIDSQSSGTLPAYVYHMMTIHFLQQVKPPVVPVLHELHSPGKEKVTTDEKDNEYFSDIPNIKDIWSSSSRQTLGELWIKMLRYYSVEVDLGAIVICIRQKKLLTRQEKKWASKKLAVEDPFTRKRNIARSLSHSQVFEYIYERLRAAYKYFAIPQTQHGPLYRDVDPHQLEKQLESDMAEKGNVCCEGEEAEKGQKWKEREMDRRKERREERKRIDKKEDLKKQNTIGKSTLENFTETGKGKEIKDMTEGAEKCEVEPKVSKSTTNKAEECAMCNVDEKNLEMVPAAEEQSVLGSLQQEDSIDEKDSESGEEIDILLIDCVAGKLAETALAAAVSSLSLEDCGSSGGGLTQNESMSISTADKALSMTEEDQILTKTKDSSPNSQSAECCILHINADNALEIRNANIAVHELCVHLKRPVLKTGSDDGEIGSLNAENVNSSPTPDVSSPTLISPACKLCTQSVDIPNDLTEDEDEEEDLSSDFLSASSKDSDEEDSAAEEMPVSADHQQNTNLRTVQLQSRHNVTSNQSSLFDSKLAEKLKPDDFVFKFDKGTLGDEQGPAVICSLCQQEGHLKQCCPEEHLPYPNPLPPLTSKYINKLTEMLYKVPGDFQPTRQEQKARDDVLWELQQVIQETYSDARLQLFGSSRNGFGFSLSDLDICLTFDNCTDPEELDCVFIIETLAKKLKRVRSLFNVFPITTAKVPIVKFQHRRSKLEGDISIYNTLAIQNTKMLQMYADLDPRVQVLGYTMKVFAKLCDICDASRGSLSSYAYILMVLYFLQQRNPPVIPVLQQLHNGDRPEKIIDGRNAWYFDDPENLPKEWPHYGKNHESVAELWVGLLRFYTEEFVFEDFVISMKQHATLTKFEKLWNSKCIAIEDPFDLSHNLGGGLSRKMNMYIQKAFRNGRELFGTPIHALPTQYQTLQDYLFDPHLLTRGGTPPTDRNCRVCGKIGHFAKECPVRGKKERTPEDRREEWDHSRPSGPPAYNAHQGTPPRRYQPNLSDSGSATPPRDIPSLLEVDVRLNRNRSSPARTYYSSHYGSSPQGTTYGPPPTTCDPQGNAHQSAYRSPGQKPPHQQHQQHQQLHSGQGLHQGHIKPSLLGAGPNTPPREIRPRMEGVGHPESMQSSHGNSSSQQHQQRYRSHGNQGQGSNQTSDAQIQFLQSLMHKVPMQINNAMDHGSDSVTDPTSCSSVSHPVHMPNSIQGHGHSFGQGYTGMAVRPVGHGITSQLQQQLDPQQLMFVQMLQQSGHGQSQLGPRHQTANHNRPMAASDHQHDNHPRGQGNWGHRPSQELYHDRGQNGSGQGGDEWSTGMRPGGGRSTVGGGHSVPRQQQDMSHPRQADQEAGGVDDRNWRAPGHNSHRGGSNPSVHGQKSYPRGPGEVRGGDRTGYHGNPTQFSRQHRDSR